MGHQQHSTTRAGSCFSCGLGQGSRAQLPPLEHAKLPREPSPLKPNSFSMGRLPGSPATGATCGVSSSASPGARGAPQPGCRMTAALFVPSSRSAQDTQPGLWGMNLSYADSTIRTASINIPGQMLPPFLTVANQRVMVSKMIPSSDDAVRYFIIYKVLVFSAQEKAIREHFPIHHSKPF